MNKDPQKRDQDLAAYSDYDQKRRHKRTIRAIAVTVIALVLVVLISALFMKRLFKVETLIVDGVENYSFNDIKSASGITEESIIFFVREKKVESLLKAKFPYVREIELERDYPSTVNIVITEEKPEFYFEYDGEYFVITSEMKILEIFREKERMQKSLPGLKRVIMPKIGRAMLSEKLELFDEKDTRHIGSLLEALSGWSEFDKIDDINVVNRFDVSVEYDGRLTLKFGSRQDIETKLSFALGILAVYSDKAQGTVIIDSIDEAVARVDDPEKKD